MSCNRRYTYIDVLLDWPVLTMQTDGVGEVAHGCGLHIHLYVIQGPVGVQLGVFYQRYQGHDTVLQPHTQNTIHTNI